ncbi:MAG: hypothetical protein HYY30_04830 [Chloroflexi bacterium]|nr:hypothetical protein [Chloroflexota bacterium]
MRQTVLRMAVAIGLAVSIFRCTADSSLAQPADFDIPGGHFFTQTSGDPDRGFAVIDDDQARFWSEFRRFGGVQAVGYPISQRFLWQGFISQAFQRVVFQWRPELSQVLFVNVFELLHDAGHDDYLLAARQVPRQAQFDEAGLSFEQIVASRLALLDENPAIRTKYFSVAGDPVQLNGLPTSPVTDMGNHLALRAQRVVFQQWKVDVPWASINEVTVALGGDIAKELDLLPDKAALQPIDAPSPLDEFSYPNLRTLPPQDISLGTITVGGERRHVVRFTNTVWNAGEGPLELRGVFAVEMQAFQRIYSEQGMFTDRLAGEFIFHPAHNHWHFEDFARYELWTKSAYDEWLASGRSLGEPEWLMSKASFCLFDTFRISNLPSSPRFRVYPATCGLELQGISVGWADVYDSTLEEQWIDVGTTPLPDGEYVLHSVADPLNRIHESPRGSDPTREGEEDNEAAVGFAVMGGRITTLRILQVGPMQHTTLDD